MSILAVYLLHPEQHSLTRIGTSFLGYDIRTGQISTPLLAHTPGLQDFAAWLEQARSFGFHATLADALEYRADDVAEIKARLAWIASRVPSFTLINGRFHAMAKYGSRTLCLTYDSPSGELQNLQNLIVTLINVLYHSSPFYEPYLSSYTADDSYHTIRYGVPHHRILDKFDLHFALITSLPDEQRWHLIKQLLLEQTGLFQNEEDRICLVDAIYLVEKKETGFFQVVERFPLVGSRATANEGSLPQ